VAIDDSVFYRKNITSVTLPNTVTLLGNYSFSSCKDLSSLSLSNGLIFIGRSAFLSCESLTTVNIPDSVISIGDGAFYGCTMLTAINVGAANPGYSSVGGVLYNKAFTTLISFPSGKSGAFVIPIQINTVADGAFSACEKLTSVTLSNNLVALGEFPFAQCISLTQINVGPFNPIYASSDGVLYNKPITTLITYPAGKTGPFTVPDTVTTINNYSFYMSVVSSVSISYSVKTINDNAFMYCSNLTTVSMSYGVTDIGAAAFAGCVNLTSLSIGSGVSKIGAGAFSGCTSLTSVVIPNGVTEIGRGAFNYCRSMTSVIVGSGVTKIGDSAFNACIALKSFTIPKSVVDIDGEPFNYCLSLMVFNVASDNPNYASLDGVLYNKHLNRLLAFPGGRTGTFDVPESVGTIMYGAFIGSNITRVNIGDSVVEIKNFAFARCENLTTVTMGKNVTAIDYEAFIYCSRLTHVTLSSGLQTIGEAAFEETNLTNIIIPASVTTIEHAAFWGCKNLTGIYFLGLGAPTTIGYNWVGNTNDSLRGHAYANSNFPTPGNKFDELLMGDVIPIVPGAPTALSSGLSGGNVTLSWGAPFLDGGSAVTVYKVYRTADPNGSYELIATTNGTICNDAAAEAGHDYWYRVIAVNANGEGAASAVVMVSLPAASGGSQDMTLNILVIIGAIAVVAIATIIMLRRKK